MLRIKYLIVHLLGRPRWLSGKDSAFNTGDTRDMHSILGSGRFPAIGNSNPLQYSCLENSMDSGVWWVTVHGVAKSHIGHERMSHITLLF